MGFSEGRSGLSVMLPEPMGSSCGGGVSFRLSKAPLARCLLQKKGVLLLQGRQASLPAHSSTIYCPGAPARLVLEYQELAVYTKVALNSELFLLGLKVPSVPSPAPTHTHPGISTMLLGRDYYNCHFKG